MKGRGPGNQCEIVCPDFDTWAEYEMLDGPIGRAAKQGPHYLVDVDGDIEGFRTFTCACGKLFAEADASRRGII